MSTDRIFSKSEEYTPRFRFRDIRGQERDEIGQRGNHFVLMFAAFRSLVDNAVAAEKERIAILHRARLLDSIRKQSLWEHGNLATHQTNLDYRCDLS